MSGSPVWVTKASTSGLWSQDLADKFTFKSRYGEPVECFRRSLDGTIIELPRGAVSTGVDWRDPGTAINFKSSFKPQKPEQPRVIQEAVELLKQDQQFIVAAPTGWGKTYVGAEIAGQVGRRFCVITTKEDIIEHWSNACKAVLNLADAEIGIWRGDKVPHCNHKVVIALVQSVMKGPERYGEDAYSDFGLVLCDEVHRMAAEQFSQAMWHFPSKLRMGMSATPWRRDGKDRVFQWHIGPVRVEATMEVLVPKVLIHRTAWTVPRSSDGEQIPHDFGNIALLIKPMTRNHQRNALIIEYLKSAMAAGRNTIAFSDSIEHLTIVRDLLMARSCPEERLGFYVGLPNDVYGVKGKKAQLLVRDAHKSRQVLFATYKMASEATDIPWLDTCLMMTPKARVEQIVGRIRREYEDKKPPIVIDLLDSDSMVLREYGNARRNWYDSLNAQVILYR